MQVESIKYCDNCGLSPAMTFSELCRDCAFIMDSKLVRKRQLEEEYRNRRKAGPNLSLWILLMLGMFVGVAWWVFSK